MLDYSQIQLVFRDSTKFYSAELVKEIETLRKTFGGILFIDRVLAALGLAKGKIYPPRGESGLKALHAQIAECGLSAHHKLSILYYLLLDHDSVAGSRAQQLAEQFATTSGLPRKYQILMKGLWYMDHQQFTFALEHLTHPSLTPEFADEIVTTLVRHASHDGDFTLPLAYYHTVHPVLRSADTLRLLFGALARTSVTEALYFSRPYPEPARRALFEHLVGSVLDGGLHASQGAGPRSSRDGGMTGRAPGRREELVGMAFDEEEERWFREFLTSGEGRSSKDARPILAARRALHSGIGSL